MGTSGSNINTMAAVMFQWYDLSYTRGDDVACAASPVDKKGRKYFLTSLTARQCLRQSLPQGPHPLHWLAAGTRQTPPSMAEGTTHFPGQDLRSSLRRLFCRFRFSSKRNGSSCGTTGNIGRARALHPDVYSHRGE